MTTDATRGSHTPGRRRSRMDVHAPAFHSFADALYTGVLVFASALPVLTAFAGFTAGVQALRAARLDDGHVTLGGFLRTLAGLRRRWIALAVVPNAVLALLLLDLVVLPATGAPDAISLGLPAVLAVVAGAFGLRFAAIVRADRSGRGAWRDTSRAMRSDAAGSALLAGAAATAGAIVAIAPVLGLVIAGPLALAAVSVDLRRRRVA